MIVAVFVLFGVAGIAPLLQRAAGRATGWLLALVPLALALYIGVRGGELASGTRIVEMLPWSPELGVSLSFALDGLSLMFALLICGIGALVLVYAGGYLAKYPQLGRFYAFLLLFMGAMLGLVLADNLFGMFLFWELTSISSYLLIGFSHEREESRAAARQALLVTGGGGLVLFAGLIMLSLAGGSSEISVLLERGDLVRASPLYLPTLALVLVGAFTKSAQFPFSFWLPGAMEAPTPVSAYLHSATMVKAGVYLLARFSPILGGTEAWLYTVGIVGAATMVIGGVLALYQTDLKRILAYSTISALGTLVLLLGLGSARAIKAAVVFLLAHALYKGALFMVAGTIDHETGTRDVERISGLRRAMPITAAVAVLAAVSLAGLGPVLSFIGKELLFEAVLDVESASVVLVPAAVFAGALFVAVAAIVGIRPFFGPLRESPKQPHEAPASMWIGPAVLAVLGLVIGLVPNLVEQSLVAPASSAILNRAEPVELYLWHGFNIALGLSVASVVGGAALYFGWAMVRRSTPWVERVFGWGPSHLYTLALDGLNHVARGVTMRVQDGYLRHYLLITLATTVGVVGWALVRSGFPAVQLSSDVRFYELGLAVLILAASAVAVRTPGRLSTVAALGVVGFGITLLYILYGAPDLAMTQILVETLTVILFVLTFYHMPRFARRTRTTARLRDAAVAISVGGLMTMLVLAATATPPDSKLAPYFAAVSVPEGFGRNIVNVILVDFRGVDTFGEITVLSIAAIGVFALLRLRVRRSAATHHPQHHAKNRERMLAALLTGWQRKQRDRQ